MANIKHVGRVVATGRKCVVVYRTLPGDAYNCLIVTTENLPENYHDSLISVVESAAAQEAYELAEALARSHFPDGSVMLPSLHAKGRLYKMPTDAIEMTPSVGVTINLAELNQIIAEQQGVAVSDLSIKPDVAEAKKSDTEVVDIAKVEDITPQTTNVQPQQDTALATQVEQLTAQVAALTAQVAALTSVQVANSAETSVSNIAAVAEEPIAQPTAKLGRKAAAK